MEQSPSKPQQHNAAHPVSPNPSPGSEDSSGFEAGPRHSSTERLNPTSDQASTKARLPTPQRHARPNRKRLPKTHATLPNAIPGYLFTSNPDGSVSLHQASEPGPSYVFMTNDTVSAVPFEGQLHYLRQSPVLTSLNLINSGGGASPVVGESGTHVLSNGTAPQNCTPNAYTIVQQPVNTLTGSASPMLLQQQLPYALIQTPQTQLPTAYTDEDPDPPVYYVNSKQYNRILKRREAREKLLKRFPQQRSKYLHESRHRHAVNRVRRRNGRFESRIEETHNDTN